MNLIIHTGIYLPIFERTTDQFDQKILHQSWELEWWTLGLMLDPLVFLISRLNIACYPHEINLQIN